ncbi:MAG TPA: XdhC family protein [Actinomycetes bacterium]|nr:XdhC family protein [Actinomycetes bacterium]
MSLEKQIDERLARRVGELVRSRTPYVLATVVRAQAPTATRAGDRAIVLSDGTIEGFVGGECAEESVRVAAVDSLRSGEPVLLRVLPDDLGAFPRTPGAHVVVNPCLSGGALEIFLEPRPPADVLQVVGDTPIAQAVVALAEVLGFDVARAAAGASPRGGTVAVVISTHGHDEAMAVRAALDAGVGFVGLVASRKRGGAVLDAMGLAEEERALVHSPVGVPIGARTPAEIALSILAAVVQARRAGGVTPTGHEQAVPTTTTDPICGMTVLIGPDTPSLVVGGVEHWFCGRSCRDRYAAQVGLA